MKVDSQSGRRPNSGGGKAYRQPTSEARIVSSLKWGFGKGEPRGGLRVQKKKPQFQSGINRVAEPVSNFNEGVGDTVSLKKLNQTRV